MSAKYLLDTNVLSEPTKRRADPGVLEALRAHEGECATCTVVWHELQFGTSLLPEGRRRSHIQAYLSGLEASALPILSYDKAAADWHALQRAALRGQGLNPPFVDGQIAAIAATNGLVLVTRNLTDFQRYTGLQLLNWWEE